MRLHAVRIPGVVIAIFLSCAGVLFAQRSFQLPEPSGNFGIGRIAFDWIDQTHNADKGQEISTHGEPDELMVYLWYPTTKPKTAVMGVLFPGAKEIDSAPGTVPGFKGGPIFGGNWAKVVLGEIASHAQDSATVVTKPAAFPVVLFSPASFGTCFEYTSAIEDLVSHGYVVASIEHTYETFAVVFPNGQVHTLPIKAIQQHYLAAQGASQEESYDKLVAWNRHRVDFRATEISFVLDKLTELNKSNSQFRGRLDLKNVAVIGHSRGGWAAVLSCRRDRRFRACANLDGANDGDGLQYPGSPVPTQPILYVEIPKTMDLPKDWVPLKRLHLTVAEWVQHWHQLVEKEFQGFPAGGYFVELKLAGMEHYSFSDRLVLEAWREESKGNEDTSLRALDLTETVTRRFLDQYLKHDKTARLESTPDINVHHYPVE